ncbi:low molecular weight protein-tyrosine-phosphatase [Shewanella sp. YIC-542]|uniref:low molecular weight protein-tyrosine-phosphatase n=1 Tax=Shewanella mytili TaxID=3377111 RepID=UPI00398E4384
MSALPELTQVRSVLFICMGNICRSPCAEAMARQKAAEYGLVLQLDSAGTTGFHQGEAPDKRARQAGERRGLDFSGMSAREVTEQDFAAFDLILAADQQNLGALRQRCPAKYQHKLALVMGFAKVDCAEVPDPYYGGAKGFERVLDLLAQAIDGLYGQIRAG